MANRPIFKFLTASGALDPENTASIDDLKQRLKAPNAKVSLYLHGGLVNRQAGFEIAEKLSARGATSLDLEDEWIQIYMVWQTGAFEELERHWDDLVKNDPLYQSVVRKLISFLSARLFVNRGKSRSLAKAVPLSDTEILKRLKGEAADKRAPFAALDDQLDKPEAKGARSSAGGRKSPDQLAAEFNQYLATDPLFKKAVADLGAAVNTDAPSRAAGTPGTALQGKALFQRLDDDVQTGLVSTLDATALAFPRGAARGPATIGAFVFARTLNIARNCIQRFRDARDHGLHATIVEEVCRELYGATVGEKVWGWMVADAAGHFKDQGFGLQLLSALADHPPARLLVIGHSAGSIWASRMLLAMADAKSKQKIDLCLLAPAVRADLFASMQTTGTSISRCRMFTMEDELERADAVLGHDKGYIYPSSLLYLVSGLFERENNEVYRDAPILGMARFKDEQGWMTPSEKVNAKLIRDFFAKADNAIHYSKSSGLTASDSHGGFDDDQLTLSSIHAQLVAA